MACDIHFVIQHGDQTKMVLSIGDRDRFFLWEPVSHDIFGEFKSVHNAQSEPSLDNSMYCSAKIIIFGPGQSGVGTVISRYRAAEECFIWR